MDESLTVAIYDGYERLFSEGESFFGPVGVAYARRTLRSRRLTKQRATDELCDLAVLADLAGRPDVLLGCADVLRAAPFTGDHTFYEPIRLVHCGAYRRAVLDGGDADPFRALISLSENGVRTLNVKSRAAAHQYKLLRDQTATTEKTGSYGAAVYAGRVAELWFMWAFGGSFQWPLKRIDAEIATVTASLQEIHALP